MCYDVHMDKAQWYTVTEAAALLKVSEWTIRRWLRAGKMKARKVERGWRIPASEVLPKD